MDLSSLQGIQYNTPLPRSLVNFEFTNDAGSIPLRFEGGNHKVKRLYML